MRGDSRQSNKGGQAVNLKKKVQDERDLQRQDWGHSIKVPEWIRKMREHYMRTGTYRPEDLRRLLGDPTKGVEIGAGASISNYFHQ